MYIGRTPFDKSVQKCHRKMQYLEEFKAVSLYKMSLQYNTVFIVAQPLSQGSYQQSCRQCCKSSSCFSGEMCKHPDQYIRWVIYAVPAVGGQFGCSVLSVRLTLKWTTNSHSNLYEVFSIVYVCVSEYASSLL